MTRRYIRQFTSIRHGGGSHWPAVAIFVGIETDADPQAMLNGGFMPADDLTPDEIASCGVDRWLEISRFDVAALRRAGAKV